MEGELDDQNVDMMIEMADKDNKGWLREEEFMGLMKGLGLIPEI